MRGFCRRVVRGDPSGTDVTERWAPIINGLAVLQRTKVRFVVGDIVLMVALSCDTGIDSRGIRLE